LLRALKLYNRLRTWPLFRQFLLLCGPLLEATGQKLTPNP
jgi:hypothetical protein